MVSIAMFATALASILRLQHGNRSCPCLPGSKNCYAAKRACHPSLDHQRSTSTRPLTFTRCLTVFALLAVAGAHAQEKTPPLPPTPSVRQLAPHVFLLPGAVPEERGPDGNTVIFEVPQGLVVVDTGRHVWHSDAILAFAAARKQDIVAIVNTHWHLDHSSGNRRLKAVFPQAQVYTTGAVDRALDSFLAKSHARAKDRAAKGETDPVQAQETQAFLDTMAHADSLRPDVTVARTQSKSLGGKTFDLRVTDRAVTDGDVWVYDPATRVAALGDLVTLPAPFFETACPTQWSTALDQVWAAPFEWAIPGHGDPMSRADFDRYRSGYKAFVACVQGKSEAKSCAATWAQTVAPLQGNTAQGKAQALEYAEYYVGMLREHGGKSAECQAPG